MMASLLLYAHRHHASSSGGPAADVACNHSFEFRLTLTRLESCIGWREIVVVNLRRNAVELTKNQK